MKEMAEKEEKLVEKAEVRDGQNGEMGAGLVVGAAEAEQAEAKDESGGGADAASDAAAKELMEAEVEADDEVRAMVSGVEIERLIAEAEARGYERGRHEGIEAWMREGVAERWDGRRVIGDDVGDSEVMILNNMRRSVWE